MNRINLVEIFIQTCKKYFLIFNFFKKYNSLKSNNLNIFNHKDIDGNTPLILAAENNNIEISNIIF